MSTHKVVEKVPKRFVRRLGDWAQEGGNNTLIVLGTDRAAPGPATVDDGLGTVEADGQGKGTGAIHLVAGRKDEDGNPDFSQDDSFLYLAQKTDADANLTSDGIEAGTKSLPAAVLKSSDVRIVFGGPDQKGSLKIFLNDGDKKRYLYSDAEMTKLSVADKTTITMKDGNVQVQVGGSKITVEDGKVTIETSTVEVKSKTAHFTGDVKMDKTLTVQGPATMQQTLDVAVKVSTPVAAVGALAAGPSPGPSVMQGPLTVSGDVKGGGKSLSAHVHPVAGSDTHGDGISLTSGPPS